MNPIQCLKSFGVKTNFYKKILVPIHDLPYPPKICNFHSFPYNSWNTSQLKKKENAIPWQTHGITYIANAIYMEAIKFIDFHCLTVSVYCICQAVKVNYHLYIQWSHSRGYPYKPLRVSNDSNIPTTITQYINTHLNISLLKLQSKPSHKIQ